MTHAFCSRIAVADEGVFPGTGVRGAVYVLLPVDKRAWGDSEMNLRWAASAELAAVKQARRSGVTTRLYDPPDSGGPILVYSPAPPGPKVAEALATLLAAFEGRGWPVDQAGGRRLAICTQGTRDRCCAKWGFSAFREAFRLYQDGLSPFEPLECSHLGGDRYAATGIFFPTGSMYGHLDHTNLQAVAEAEAAGRMLPGHYRGRVFDEELVQIIRAGLAKEGRAVTATSPITVLNPLTAAAELKAEVRTEEGAFAVSLDTVDAAFFGSCEAVAEGRMSRAKRLVYRSAQPVAAAAS